jgi:hypothetical protein
VIVAHLAGLPIEETVMQFAPAGTVTMTAVAIAGRSALRRLLRRRSS